MEDVNGGISIEMRLPLSTLFAHAIEAHLNSLSTKKVMEIQNYRLK